MAPTFGCAWAIARYDDRGRSIIDDRGVRSVLEPLPVRALRVEPQIEASLNEVGIDRVGHLFDLPRTQLATRFGDELLLRLDQALGQAIEVIDPVRPVEAPCVEVVFNGATTGSTPLNWPPVNSLSNWRRSYKVQRAAPRRLDLVLDRIDCQPQRVVITLSRASRNVKHLLSLIRPKLEKVHLGFGVERVSLAASRTGPLPHVQARYTSHAERDSQAQVDPHFGELIDTLVNRLGHDHVLTFEPLATHIPNARFDTNHQPPAPGTPGIPSPGLGIPPGSSTSGIRSYQTTGKPRGRSMRSLAIARRCCLTHPDRSRLWP